MSGTRRWGREVGGAGCPGARWGCSPGTQLLFLPFPVPGFHPQGHHMVQCGCGVPGGKERGVQTGGAPAPATRLESLSQVPHGSLCLRLTGQS